MLNKIILASKSEVRKEILDKNNIKCVVEPSNVDEEPVKESLLKEQASSEIISKNLAELKANKVSMKKNDEIVLGADSVIDLEGELISKPESREEAMEILRKLNGKSHFLISSVCISKNGSMIWNYTDKAELTMKVFKENELKEYLSKITDDKNLFLPKNLFCLSNLFSSLRGGLAIAVTLIGMLLAASTGIVGATVVTMGLLGLPSMQKNGYSPELSSGTICASGTLGQIIPPSIVLVMLGDVISSSYQFSQLNQGIYSPRTVSVGDLFAGALIPGLILVVMYILYILIYSHFNPEPPKAKNPDDNKQSLSITFFNSLIFPGHE